MREPVPGRGCTATGDASRSRAPTPALRGARPVRPAAGPRAADLGNLLPGGLGNIPPLYPSCFTPTATVAHLSLSDAFPSASAIGTSSETSRPSTTRPSRPSQRPGVDLVVQERGARGAASRTDGAGFLRGVRARGHRPRIQLVDAHGSRSRRSRRSTSGCRRRTRASSASSRRTATCGRSPSEARTVARDEGSSPDRPQRNPEPVHCARAIVGPNRSAGAPQPVPRSGRAPAGHDAIASLPARR